MRYELILSVVAGAMPSLAYAFDLTIPVRTASQDPVRQVTTHIDVADPNNIVWIISNGTAEMSSPVVGAGGNEVLTFANGDLAIIERSTGSRFSITVSPDSLLTTGGACATPWASNDVWTVAARRGTSTGPVVNVEDGACLVASGPPRTACDDPWAVLTDPPFPFIGAGPGAGPTCGSARPDVDLMMVLDRSCSMGSLANPGSGTTTTRMQALHTAMLSLRGIWQTLRSGETPARTDRLGVVYFQSVAEWKSTVAGGLSTPSASLAGFDAIRTELDGLGAVVGPAGATALGQGLSAAGERMAAESTGSARKVVLLITDGMQNVSPMAEVAGTTVNLRNGTTVTPLVGQANLDIWTVTTGSCIGCGTIQNALATATGGRYVSSVDGSDLNLFFSHFLENFLRMSTYQTLALRSATLGPASSMSMSFGVSTTSDAPVISVTSDDGGRQGGFPFLEIYRPGSAGPPERVGIETRHFNRRLDKIPGLWRVDIRTHSSSVSGSEAALRVHSVVVADDLVFKAHIGLPTPSGRGFRPGEKIRLEVATRAGLPALGVDVKARAIRPGEDIGDVLSRGKPDPTRPAEPEGTTPAEAKLETMLAQQPGLLAVGEKGVVELLDTGVAPDTKAGDGVYTAEYPADVVGDHTFYFEVTSTKTKTGTITRAAVETTYVHTYPDPPTLQPQLVGGALVLTPKTPTGHLVGPGWDRYIVFQSGTEVVLPTDQLNGSYAVSLTPGKKYDVFWVEAPMKLEVGLPGTAYGSGGVVPLGPVLLTEVDSQGGGHVPGGGPTTPPTTPSCWSSPRTLLLLLLLVVVIAFVIRRLRGP